MSETSPDETLAAYLRRRMDELEIGSLRELARRIGVSPETARWLVDGGGRRPDEVTLRKIAEKLPAPIQLVRELAGRPAGALGRFELPPEADQLDREQRAVVLSMVSVLLRATRSGDTGSADSDRPRIAARRREPDE